MEDDFKKLHEDIDMDEDEPEMDPELFIRADAHKMQNENRDHPKTQKEIMMEVGVFPNTHGQIIEKSKAFREERKREADAVSNEIESVDAMMDDLHSLLSFNKKDASKRVEVQQSKEDEEYDRLTAQLAFQRLLTYSQGTLRNLFAPSALVSRALADFGADGAFS